MRLCPRPDKQLGRPVQIPKGSGDGPLRVPAIVMPSYREGEVWCVGGGQLSIEPQPVLRRSSLLTVRDAAVAGAGAAMLPQSIIGSLLNRGELVSWGLAGEDVELWVLHTSRRLQSPKVRAFVDFLCSQYPDGSFSIPIG
jgi:DNA-binding transcriptional LysR family regulator